MYFSVDAAIYYRVMDPIASAIFITDPHLSTKQLAQSTLRNVLGTRTLTEIMCERESIALQAQEVLDEGTGSFLDRICLMFCANLFKLTSDYN